MDIKKADYGTVIRFGKIGDFLEKLKFENKEIKDVIDITDNNGISLLEKALISRKFDIAKYLINENAKVNVISNEECNELHYLAANINFTGAIEIANILISRNVDLTLKDKKYGNSALLTLCQEILKKRTNEGIEFLIRCLNIHSNVDISDENKAGYSVKRLIEERGTDEIKKALEVI